MSELHLNTFGKQIDDLLKKFPNIKFERNADVSLYIPKQTVNGFDIGIEQFNLTLLWGNWHSPMLAYTVEEVFHYIHIMLTNSCRVREYYKWPLAYRGFLEFYENNTWVIKEIMGLLFWNYFAPKSIRIYQNNLLAS
jgi:hypothetical protein